jgi:hypothetical protein
MVRKNSPLLKYMYAIIMPSAKTGFNPLLSAFFAFFAGIFYTPGKFFPNSGIYFYRIGGIVIVSNPGEDKDGVCMG